MSIQIQWRRGTTAQHNVFTGALGEVTVDTDKDTIVVHDGSTVGGFPLARESQMAALSGNVYTKEESNTSLALKVDKLIGKGLSTEDYSTAEKTKLDGLSNYTKPSSEPISYITDLQTALDAKATTTALNTEKGRIDAMLLAADANADTFAEVVTLVNSIDTTNDQAFAGYVLSNDARSATIEGNVTNLTSSKADKATTYTKSETDAKIIELSPATDISGKADKATTLDGYGITDAYTKTASDTSLALKVDKVAGKQLSTEDYSTAEKSKLAGIAASANNYSLPVANASVLGGVKAGANVTIDVNGVISASSSGGMVLGTSVSATGTSIDFTGIPSWAIRITVMFNGVSLSGASDLLIKLGTSSGIVSSGYISTSGGTFNAGVTALSSTVGLIVYIGGSTRTLSGLATLTKLTNNTWVSSHSGKIATINVCVGGGNVVLPSILDRVRITTVNGTDSLDAGQINIMYEG